MVRDAALRAAPHHEDFETPRYARLLTMRTELFERKL